jgi:hypothetical protein
MNSKAETVQLDDQDLLRIKAAIKVDKDQLDQAEYHLVK